jgi:hypothetical protein
VHTWFWRGNLRVWDHLEGPDVDRRIILKWIFEKWDGEWWTGSIWLRIAAGGGLVWMRWWAFGFHKMRGISWVAENLLASQEGLCSMECIWKFECSGTWRRVDGWVPYDVAKDSNACIFGVNYLRVNTTSHPRRTDSLAAPLWWRHKLRKRLPVWIQICFLPHCFVHVVSNEAVLKEGFRRRSELFGRGQEIFLFSKTLVQALGPSKTPTQWVPRFFPQG